MSFRKFYNKKDNSLNKLDDKLNKIYKEDVLLYH
jgi:hypothetical protein